MSKFDYMISQELSAQINNINQAAINPSYWTLTQLGIDLYDNQVSILDTVTDLSEPYVAVLASRGSGKSFACAIAIAKMCLDNPGFRVGIFGPKAETAKRLLKEDIIGRILTPSSKVYDQVDWNRTSNSFIQFKNGSTVKSLSASPTATQESEHFHVIFLDENHRINDTVLKTKIVPMLGSFTVAKTVKIGISLYKNNFWHSCNDAGTQYKVLRSPWNACDIYWLQGSIQYQGKDYPKRIVDLMPKSVKEKLFPLRYDINGIDLWYDSTEGFTEIEWNTQYEMIWMEDINLVLSANQLEKLSSGLFKILDKGRPELTEKYYFGLDTASGSLMPGQRDLDWTVLTILRKNQDNTKDICLSGDTKIKLLNGTSKTIKELSELPNLDNIWVYSVDNDLNIVPGKVTKAWKTATRKTVKITLDNGDSFSCTPEHLVMMRDGTYRKAEDLKSDDSLMPLYTQLSVANKLKKTLTGYELLYNPKTGTWEYTHRIVAENVYGNSAWPNVIHHKNFIKTNNSPENLLVLPFKDHVKLHQVLAQDPARRAQVRETMKNLWANLSVEERTKWVDALKEGHKKYYKTELFEKNWRANLEKAYAKLDSMSDEELSILRNKGKTFEEIYGEEKAKEIKEKISTGNTGVIHTEESKMQMAQVAKDNDFFDHFLVNDNWISSLKKRSKYIAIINQYSEEELKKLLITKEVKELKKLWNCGHKTIWKLRRIFKCNKRATKIPIPTNFLYKNHKVVSVEKNIIQDVYDLTVDNHHNFALDCGIFVHNCAKYAWQGDVVEQMQEIRDLIHPTEGVFKCVMGLADYSNIAIGIVEMFKKEGIPIAGVTFGATEPITKKNYKNAMFDQFIFELDSGRIFYPSLETIQKNEVFKEGYEQWSMCERHRKLGINDKLGVDPAQGHDDHCSADILACFAATQERDYAGKVPQTMRNIPMGISGPINTSGSTTPYPGQPGDPNQGRFLRDRMT